MKRLLLFILGLEAGLVLMPHLLMLHHAVTDRVYDAG